jgi:chromate transporter
MDTAKDSSSSDLQTPPSLIHLFKVCLKIGLLSFGGPAAQIALMHRAFVEEERWLTEKQYLNALGFCMLLPGPEAMQLATYAGWKVRGTVGGLIAGLLFVIPGALIILLFATVYVLYEDQTFNGIGLIDTLFLGVKAAVIIIVFQALIKVSKKALHHQQHWLIAACSFIAIFFLSIPFPLIILAAVSYGFFTANAESAESQQSDKKHLNNQSFKRTLAIIIVGCSLWILPIIGIAQFMDESILSELASFFAKLAVVTFGGAYAVLVYMTQDVVTQFGWLSAGEMMDALGLAETTPGPLILVTEFVGFIAAFREGGLFSGVLGAAVTLWVTFVPCFIWIFAGAPYIEWMHSQQRLSAALSSITAAVVGVILNLSIWFSLHVFFKEVELQTWNLSSTLNINLTLWQPNLSSFDWRVLLLTLLCAGLFFYRGMGVVWVLLISSFVGWGLTATF